LFDLACLLDHFSNELARRVATGQVRRNNYYIVAGFKNCEIFQTGNESWRFRNRA
jgi:hypothetical protein